MGAKKGIKFTEEHKQNISLALMGHEVSKEIREKISKKLTGKPLSLEQRKHISEGHKGLPSKKKGITGIFHHSLETRKKLSDIKKGIPKSEEYKRKLSDSLKGKMRGSNNPNWKNGSSINPYDDEFDEDLRNQIRNRDNFVCQICGIKESELKHKRKMSIHHIDYDKNNSSPENLITLCYNCHSLTNGKRQNWIRYFGGMIKCG